MTSGVNNFNDFRENQLIKFCANLSINSRPHSLCRSDVMSIPGTQYTVLNSIYSTVFNSIEAKYCHAEWFGGGLSCPSPFRGNYADVLPMTELRHCDLCIAANLLLY